MISSSIVNVSRMTISDFDQIIVVPLRPVLSAYRTVATATEGGSVIFEVRRSGVETGGCSCTWTAVSAGGTADLSGPTTGTVAFGNNEVTPARVTVQTVNRSGTQGDRELTFVISNGQGGDLDPTRLSASTTIRDRAVSSLWWQLSTSRGNRANGRMSGPSYWGSSGSSAATNFRIYENEVGYMDAFNGGISGKGGDFDKTMLMATGGPTDTINRMITDNSQLDWSRSTSHWTAGWRTAAKGCWCVWTCNFIGEDERTDRWNSGTDADPVWHEADNSIWQDIIDGAWRKAYISMGQRISDNIDGLNGSNPRGHEANRLLIRMFHENNQSNFYQVVPAFKLKYKEAMENVINWVREGLGDYSQDVKFAHAPAHGSKWDLGDYDSWAPSNCDIYSVSWHPTVNINSDSQATKYMAGTDGGDDGDGTETASRYGPEEVAALAAARATPTPTMYPEWSPKKTWTTKLKNACPIANTMVTLFDQFLTANKENIVCDCAYSETGSLEMIRPNAYQNTDAKGIQQWKDMVTTYKTKWSGDKGPA